MSPPQGRTPTVTPSAWILRSAPDSSVLNYLSTDMILGFSALTNNSMTILTTKSAAQAAVRFVKRLRLPIPPRFLTPSWSASRLTTYPA